MLSSHGREIGTQDALKKESQGLSQVAAGNPGFPRLEPVTSGGGFLAVLSQSWAVNQGQTGTRSLASHK